MGRNLINPVSIPSFERYVIMTPADITTVEMPTSLVGINRAAMIQNNNPKKDERKEFNTNAIELRYK